MKKLLTIILLFPISAGLAWANVDSNVSGPLHSAEMLSIKKRYETCVIEKGNKIFNKSGLRDAMDFAPLACRKELLRAKKFMLEGAFKIEVIDQLVDSIEQGVKIDLANNLIKQL